MPDVRLGSHTASLGLTFDDKNSFPEKYKGGAFIGQHGSWNSSKLVGYQIAFVPFKNGKPSGDVEPFLTGFVADKENNKIYGRPVGVAFTSDGTLLVAELQMMQVIQSGGLVIRSEAHLKDLLNY